VRPAVVAANWKMYKTGAQASAFFDTLLAAGPWTGPTRLVVCPPFTAIETCVAKAKGSPVGIGGQDCYWEPEGAFTGQVAAGMLKAAGCGYVIIGHSERRRLFQESDETVNKKLNAAVKEGLTPILCVGETLSDRDAGRTEQVVWSQLTYGLDKIPADVLKGFIVAYEPVWAIGTGRTATPEQAQEVHGFIRAFLAKQGAGVDAVVPVLYGGSVKPENIEALMKGPDVDGALIGGAALDPAGFAAIARGAARARPA